MNQTAAGAIGMIDSPQFRERFYDRCIPEPNSGCWLWDGHLSACGYGKICVKGAYVGVHRLSHFLATGEWPTVVRHKCDNPGCINPQHLEGGTWADNVHDMDKRGRRARGFQAPGRRGGNHYKASLTDQQAREVKTLLRSGESKRLIADAMGVKVGVIYNIASGLTWSWLDVDSAASPEAAQ